MSTTADHTDLVADRIEELFQMSHRELATALAQAELDLAEAQSSESWMLEQKALMRDQRDRAEERECVLFAGIAQAKNLALTPSTTGGMITTLQAKVAEILSRLLPSTTNEKGNDDDH